MTLSPDARAALNIAAAEIWLIEPIRGEALASDLVAFLSARHIDEASAARLSSMRPPPKDEEDCGYTVSDGVAEIALAGVVMKQVPWVMQMCGGACSAQAVQASVERAAADPEVQSILLVIDSPGGTMAGTQELADAIHAASAQKPVVAFASDLAASAAFWAGSQASEFHANETAHVGSIGVYRSIVDSSRAFEDQGLKVHLLRSGAQKGVGAEGVPISADQLAVEQRMIEQAAELFVGAVARGRGMTPESVRALATGRTWFAGDAASLGLIDGVSTLAGARQRARDLRPSATSPTHLMPSAARPPQGAPPMSETKTDTTELDSLRAELEAEKKARALAEQAAAIRGQALAERTAADKKKIVEQGVADGRITPALRAGVEDYAAKSGEDVEGLRAFVASLPVQTRAGAVGATPPVEPGSAPAASDADKAVAKILRINPAAMAAADQVESVTSDGVAILKSGERKKLSDVVNK